MTSPYDPNYDGETNDADMMLPYDSSVDDMTEEEAIAELVADGYSEDEAKRMVGLYDYDDDTCYGDDDLDRDVPDFVDGGDFE